MNRIDQAIEFAASAHKDQLRKGTAIPYVSHPFAVAMIVQQAGCKEDIVIAGLLHDTLEDTETSEEEIKVRFGEEVLRLVKGASEPDKDASWEDRKRHTLEELRTADLDIRQLACADKLHNIRSIKRDIEISGDAVWSRFKRGFDQQRWYYLGLVESLGHASNFSMLEALKKEVKVVFPA